MTIVKDKPRTRVVFRLPKKLQDDMNAQIGADGYGMMGKSRWINEAIDQLLKKSEWMDRISYEINTPQDAKEDVLITCVTNDKLKKYSNIMATKLPISTAAKSAIIRHAIMARIIDI
jgi:hypothetical protein